MDNQYFGIINEEGKSSIHHLTELPQMPFVVKEICSNDLFMIVKKAENQFKYLCLDGTYAGELLESVYTEDDILSNLNDSDRLLVSELVIK
jgi:hypothetical protein